MTSDREKKAGSGAAGRAAVPAPERAVRKAVAVALAACSAAALAAGAPPAYKASPYAPKVTARAMQYYAASGGVEDLSVKLTASGNLIRFSYRVVNPAVAKALVDKAATPYLYGQRSHALLQVPSMENIGQLRQSGALEVGREYWMVFSNKGNLVKAGDRVNVIVGTYHIDGLMVE